jgi:hypothetical protein
VRRRNHRHQHRHKAITIRQNAIRHKHATQQTKKRVTTQTTEYNRQKTLIRNRIVKEQRNIKTYQNTVTK